jgi:hypothetical protein
MKTFSFICVVQLSCAYFWTAVCCTDLLSPDKWWKSKIQVFWDVIPCHWVSSLPQFKGPYCCHLQDQAVQFYSGHEGTTIVWNVLTYSPSDTATHPRKLGS